MVSFATKTANHYANNAMLINYIGKLILFVTIQYRIHGDSCNINRIITFSFWKVWFLNTLVIMKGQLLKNVQHIYTNFEDDSYSIAKVISIYIYIFWQKESHFFSYMYNTKKKHSKKGHIIAHRTRRETETKTKNSG